MEWRAYGVDSIPRQIRISRFEAPRGEIQRYQGVNGRATRWAKPCGHVSLVRFAMVQSGSSTSPTHLPLFQAFSGQH
jgi:hypothetical protein